jgi:uncharacterized protein DUF1573
MQRHIKTAILAFCAVLLVTASALAAGKPKAVVTEPLKDAGVIPKGDKITHDFIIRNEGDAVLEITNVQPACGCTVVEFDKSIAPGQTGKVHAVLDTTDFGGPIGKGVTVFTNDPDTPQIELTIHARVEPRIAVKPGYARYIVVQKESVQGTIAQTLWAPDGTPFEVTSVESPWPFMKVAYHEAKPEERIPNAEGRQWRVDMTLSNDEAKVGALADYVTIHTTHPKQKIVQIPVSGFVRPVMAVTPPRADFGSISLKEPVKTSINIQNFATEPIRITSVESVKGVDAKVEPLQEGREYQVRLVLNQNLGKGAFNGKLKIHTDSPKVPVLEVELKGTVL